MCGAYIYIYIYIYYSAWADQRHRMSSYTAYRPQTQQYTHCSCDRMEYIAESGVYISTAESILVSQGCIFRLLLCNGRAQASLGELLPALYTAPRTVLGTSTTVKVLLPLPAELGCCVLNLSTVRPLKPPPPPRNISAVEAELDT